ncbi:TBC1 domain family member 16-like [Mytilus californianus]|uniref:TBC1 domain family member 16-like n=1 Tax=Mytilus californianus TaxID=6549 RepID=UPI002246DB51|nr:TBC1 domain family member 16-like [Mytilus californianus]
MDPVMAFSTIFKKATNLLGIGGSDLKPPPLDGEIIYCKNNVCVHPPAPLTMDSEHHPGYLNIRSQMDKSKGPTLILTWIPNSSLKKNPRSIENSPNKTDDTAIKPSPRRQPRPEFSKVTTPSPVSSPRGSSISSDVYEYYLDRGPVRSKKKHSLDNSSVNSEVSVGSRDEFASGESWSQFDESGRKLSLSSKSQTDSGLGPDHEEIVQNNEKNFKGEYVRMNKIGVNVNNLQTSKGNNCSSVKKTEVEEMSSPDTSDSLTAEEQLAAMLNRNKLHAKVKENKIRHKSVSIEMEGDNIVIVTEELEKDMIVDHDKYSEEHNINKNESKFDTTSSSSMSQSTDGEGISLSSDSTHPSPSGAHYNQMLNELKENVHKNVTENGHCDHLTESSDLKSNDVNYINEKIPHKRSKVPTDLNYRRKSDEDAKETSGTTPDISVTRYRTMSESSSSTTTSGPDSKPLSLSSSPENYPSLDPNFIESPSSCDSSVYSHNLSFPNNSVTYSRSKGLRKHGKDQVCGVFSVDLGQMRSLRLFYSDPECTKGQVVIASRESQYKILHFHTGGLDKLAEIFKDWNLFAQDQSKESRPYKQFLIVRPQLTDDQCHPEEGVYSMVDDEMWKRHMIVDGQIEDNYQLRKHIFFGGLEPSLRHEAWPFLLHYYPYDSTFDEREQIRNDRYIEYQNIRKQRESMNDEEQEQFWRRIQSTVEKDVIRTDRSHSYFKGEDNPNIEVLQSILLNYAVANPTLGYTQGMSDLLAPVLAEIQNEADAYWCFVGLMQRTLFVSSPKDNDMDKQLNYLKELLRLMQSDFYYHLNRLGEDAMELLFCHRWILLCFKREFPEVDALRIWEACWSHYQTDYFHLFICVAIVSIYGDDVIDQGLPSDEILLHFSSLAMHMNGDLVLRKARGLLHDFRQIPKIPCTLHGLCSLCGPGMWDSGHVPIVECAGNHVDDICPYHSNPTSPTHALHSMPGQ